MARRGGNRLAAVAAVACLGALAGSAPAGATSLGDWYAAPSMGTPRAETPAVATLGDGRVLTAGGSSDGSNAGAVKTAEVYDPLTGVWSAAADMPAARIGAAAVTLADGRVLVAGGDNASSQPQSTVYVYDPASDTWSSVTSMSAVRAWPSAARLADGRVLVAGGSTTGNALTAGAEIYNPAADSWTPTGSLAQARDQAAAATLGDGRVVLTGGYAGTSLKTTELFNPATRTWSAGPDGNLRDEGAAAALPDGRVLVVDGSTDSASVSDAELYDPSSNGWTAAADSGLARYGVGAATMADGRVLLVGGDDDVNPLTTAQLYASPPSPSAHGLSFGAQIVGRSAGTRTLSVTNLGVQPLMPSGATITGANAGEFTIVTDGCRGRSLSFGQSCPVDVAFIPGATGARFGSLQLADNAAGSPHGFTLSGSGVAADAGPQGPQGPAGQTGAAGPAGPAGAVRLVTCRQVTSHVRRHGKRVTVHHRRCTTSLVSGTATFNVRSLVRATLSRHGRVYATGAMHGSRLVLHPRRALRPGRYRLALLVRHGRRTVRRTGAITLR